MPATKLFPWIGGEFRKHVGIKMLGFQHEGKLLSVIVYIDSRVRRGAPLGTSGHLKGEKGQP